MGPMMPNGTTNHNKTNRTTEEKATETVKALRTEEQRLDAVVRTLELKRLQDNSRKRKSRKGRPEKDPETCQFIGCPCTTGLNWGLTQTEQWRFYCHEHYDLCWGHHNVGSGMDSTQEVCQPDSGNSRAGTPSGARLQHSGSSESITTDVSDRYSCLTVQSNVSIRCSLWAPGRKVRNNKTQTSATVLESMRANGTLKLVLKLDNGRFMHADQEDW